MKVELTEFLRKWFCGPDGYCWRVREFGYCLGPLDSCGFRRDTYALEGFLQEFERLYVRGYPNLNAFLSIASYNDLDMNTPIYDSIHFDFDDGEDPSKALTAALDLARKLKERYGCDSVIYSTGIKGAHLVIPLKPVTNWEGYRLAYSVLLSLSDKALSLNDPNMLQQNRLDRIPYTWNVKKDKRAYVRILSKDGEHYIKPEEFDWSNYEPLNLSNVEVTVFSVNVPRPKFIIPKRLLNDGSRYRWINQVVKWGLPDGRHRFILYTLTPYLANVLGLGEDDALNMVNQFISNSCRNHKVCTPVYSSWVRSALRGAKRKGLRPRGLRSWEQKDPQLYSLIKQVLNLSFPVRGKQKQKFEGVI